MRTVTINDTDQTLRLFAFDSNSSAVTGLTSGSAGLAVNVIVRQEGIKTGTTDITSSLTTRDTAATHKDYAFTEIGSGEYELDLPDSFFTTAQEVTASIAATAITGRSYATTVTVEVASLDASGVRAAVGLASANLDTQLGALPTNAPLDATGIRTAVGLATGNLDTQLSAIPTTAPLDAAGTRAALGMSAANLDTQLSTIDTEVGQVLDRAGYTVAVLTGAISDADTSTNTFAVTIDGVTYTVTNNGIGEDGDRAAPTLAKA